MLVIVGGLFGGMFIGTLWVIVREWLPKQIWLRTVISGGGAMLVGSFVFLDAENRDFMLFGPTVPIIVMFMVLAGLAGSGTAYGDHILRHRLPGGARASTVYGVLVAVGAIFPLMIFIPFFFQSGAFVSEPPRVVGAMVLFTAAATLLSWARYLPPRLGVRRTAPWARVPGVAGVIAMSIFGALHLAGQIGRITS